VARNCDPFLVAWPIFVLCAGSFALYRGYRAWRDPGFTKRDYEPETGKNSLSWVLDEFTLPQGDNPGLWSTRVLYPLLAICFMGVALWLLRSDLKCGGIPLPSFSAFVGPLQFRWWAPIGIFMLFTAGIALSNTWRRSMPARVA
jgi:hypothetical protein